MKAPALVAVLALAATSACHHAAPSTTTVASAVPAGVTAEMITRGDSIFNNMSCVRCHGPKGVGGVRGPNLTDQTWIHIDGSYDAIVQLVTTGFTKAQQKDPQYQFAMNPRGGMNFSDDQIRAVAAYVWSLSHAR